MSAPHVTCMVHTKPHSLGQSLMTLSFCRTSSSLKMSNQANSTPFSRSSPTIWREKPHLGEDGLPFMNNTTLWRFMIS